MYLQQTTNKNVYTYISYHVILSQDVFLFHSLTPKLAMPPAIPRFPRGVCAPSAPGGRALRLPTIVLAAQRCRNFGGQREVDSSNQNGGV